jgi:hypothetical protein
MKCGQPAGDGKSPLMIAGDGMGDGDWWLVNSDW